MSFLLDALREAGATGQVSALASRAAAHISLDNPSDVAALLDALRMVGATGQVIALLDRDPAAHASLDNPSGVAALLDALREAGATGQVTTLADRLPAAGMFELFCGQDRRAEQFRFGREADGRPAKPWAWTDLDLWLVLRPEAP